MSPIGLKSINGSGTNALRPVPWQRRRIAWPLDTRDSDHCAPAVSTDFTGIPQRLGAPSTGEEQTVPVYRIAHEIRHPPEGRPPTAMGCDKMNGLRDLHNIGSM